MGAIKGSVEDARWAKPTPSMLLGRLGEEKVVEYLRSAGWRILARNWRCAKGEIDVIAADGETIVFVEVKTRTTYFNGHPLESITPAKLERLRLLAAIWCGQQTLYWPHLRIDAVAVHLVNVEDPMIEHVQGVG